MSGDAAEDVVGGFYENFNLGDLDVALGAFADDLETVDPGMGVVHGIPPFREYLQTFKRAMPDARAIIEHTYGAADMVIVEGRFVGTHTGPLTSSDGDIAPSGASVDLRFADLSRVIDGRIASYDTYYDQLELLTQLGLMGET